MQWLDLGESYELRAFDGGFALECNLPKDSLIDIADFETNFKAAGNKSPVSSMLPFASKTMGSKKLYKRVHGISNNLSLGDNTILFTVPYAWAKITGIELINGVAGDVISLYVLDSTTGTYSTIPNYSLNQFGFSVNVAPNFYEHKSEFDADLYLGMQLKIVYTSTASNTVGINIILNEMKS